jgi:hypothetical protein
LPSKQAVQVEGLELQVLQDEEQEEQNPVDSIKVPVLQTQVWETRVWLAVSLQVLQLFEFTPEQVAQWAWQVAQAFETSTFPGTQLVHLVVVSTHERQLESQALQVEPTRMGVAALQERQLVELP